MAQNNTINERLKQALELYNERWVAQFPTDEELTDLHTFSPSFIKKIKALIKVQKKPYYVFVNTVGKRVAAIILAIVIALSTTVFSVKALRDLVISFFVKVYEKFTSLSYTANDSVPSSIQEIYMPTYIPKNYSLNSSNNYNVINQIIYSNTNNDVIRFEQRVKNLITFSIDTEGTTYENVKINNCDGIFYSNKGTNNFIWENDRYSFYVSGTIDRATLLKIAQSVKIKK